MTDSSRRPGGADHFVRYEHPAARPLWSAAALVHRLSVPRLLNHALMNT
jgi:hypothetical protein